MQTKMRVPVSIGPPWQKEAGASHEESDDQTKAMLSKSDIYKRISELTEECAIENHVIHLDVVTACLAKFPEEHQYSGHVARAAAQYVAAYDRACRRKALENVDRHI
jgi:hypothetical protein